ncbi:MAG: LysR substrate-binding domain-containing protein [Roseovarius sp.]|uniref:LysR substrate-binding domain-containing protein n=2 Tax=Roseovarius sp. TaxID=1486281 RepID=UPI0032ED37C4
MSRYSMSTLRAFAAVGRHGGFSRAAAELRISQSAVSRHVAALERDLECRLFDRTTRHCTLTDEGRALHHEISHGLAQIDRGIAAARNATADPVLHISVAPFLSAAWFTPRLLGFLRDNPDLDIRLTHAYSPPDFDVDSIDIGLNWSLRPERPGIVAEPLLSGELIPVCSPDYARARIDPDDPASLLRCELFHEFRTEDWATWFARQSLAGVTPTSQQISDTGALRQAAIAGQGVALLFRALVQDEISNGQLVAPFPVAVTCGEAYWLTFPARQARRPALKRVLRWLRREAAATAQRLRDTEGADV